MKFESSFKLKEDPFLRQESRDSNELPFLRKGAKPFFGLLIFVGTETISLFGLVEEDLGNLIFFEREASLFILDEEVLGFSIFFNGRAPPFVLLFAKCIILFGLEEDFVFFREETIPLFGFKEDGLDIVVFFWTILEEEVNFLIFSCEDSIPLLGLEEDAKIFVRGTTVAWLVSLWKTL
jgi:hypothetical protein